MINGKFLLLMLIALPAVMAQYKYCNQTLCKEREHIACKAIGFSSKCKNQKIEPIDQKLRNLIVETHNNYRSQIAKGFKDLPPGPYVGPLKWNKELAYLAELNVRQCEMKHDCHNTNNFPKSGQNLAKSWLGQNPNVTQNVIVGLENWFIEYKHCPVAVIDKLYNPYPNDPEKQVLHFTAMIQEKSTDVGCAVLRYQEDTGSTVEILCCNYSYNNIGGQPVYRRA